ncbi:MAG: hypothetical protein JWM44_3951 [Bacilli bacterium]|jgi:hypothetical protein|nr:hypothetical protein [Bacilli bacterium]
MKCDDIQELFGIYFDLPDDDLRRKSVDEHILQCRVCAEDFEIWLESTNLIRSVQAVPQMTKKATPIASKVMDRIYEDESWRVPVADRIYAIPYKLRRNLTAMIALCLAVFMFSFLFNLVYVDHHNTGIADEPTQLGFTQIASASGLSTTAVASTSDFISEPLKSTLIHTPDYWLAISLLGLISALLTMNWLSRTRS